ncbi:uncharacterized [Tachysurus ichikawai]
MQGITTIAEEVNKAASQAQAKALLPPFALAKVEPVWCAEALLLATPCEMNVYQPGCLSSSDWLFLKPGPLDLPLALFPATLYLPHHIAQRRR